MIQKFIILFILCFILYSPSIKGPFTFDDQAILVLNPSLQHLSQEMSGIIDVWNFQPSRFLTNLTIASNYYFHGLDVFGYHLINILIHLMTTLCVWILTGQILRIKGENKLTHDLPFWAAVLFLVHPLQTESISYLNQRSSAFVSLFYVLSVIFYLKARVAIVLKVKVINFAQAVFFAICAVLSKETAITLPLAWILIDYFVLARSFPRWLWGMAFFMFIFVAFLFNFKITSVLFNPVYSQSHAHEFLTLKTYLLTQFQVLVVFIKLIFIPIGLNLDYDFPMAHSLIEPATFFSFIFLSTLLYLAFFLRKSYWYISFAIFWFFISLLGHILPPRANVIAEHKLYLTLTLLIPVITYGFYKHISKKIFLVIIVLVSGVMFVLTFQRNMLWSDPVLIWKDTVSKSPNKARAHLNLGVSYSSQGKLDEAFDEFMKAIKCDPLVPDAFIGASQILSKKHNLNDAYTYANKAVDIAPDISLPYVQRGIILAQQKENELALEDFSKAIQINPHDLQIYKMRAVIEVALKNDTKAIEDFNIWLSENPKDIESLSQRADIFFRNKKYQLALQDYNDLIKLTSFAPYYYNRSVLNEILGNKSAMTEDRQKAKELGFNK